jgi:hypothetical protein
MSPKWHILIGFVFSYLLVFFFHLSILSGIVIFLSSWLLIDLDHYFRYVYLTKNLSPVKFWKWSMEQKRKYEQLSKEEKSRRKKPVFIFHGIEFWILLALLSLLSRFFLLILAGILMHMLADWADMLVKREDITYKISAIYTAINNSRKKNDVT